MQNMEDDSFYIALRAELEARFGRRIKYSKDSRLLSDQLFDATGRRLSESTIKRFFGIISTVFKPSRYTLDTFSVFLGYEGWNGFMHSKKYLGAKASGNVDQKMLKDCFDAVTEVSISSMESKTGYM